MAAIKNIFATPIQEFTWDRSSESLDKIKNHVHNKQPISESEEFVSWVLDCANDYATALGKMSGYLVCRDIWQRTITEAHSYVPPHTHPSTWAVGTFYFEEGQGDLVLIDPRGFTNDWEWREIKDIDGHRHSSCNDFYYKPKKDTAIFFPGYLKHLVLPSNQKRNRTALSWNILYVESKEIIKLFGVKDYQVKEINYEM